VTDGYDLKELEYQLEGAKRKLNEQGYDVITFAYPRGEDNEQIVDLVKKFYLAGRDTLKFNSWRDRRSAIASFDKDYIWHMNYYKPELETPMELESSIGYNGWWQFEEGYRHDNENINNTIRTLSSVDPTENSFAVVHMEDINDQVSNKFIVSKDSDYMIEVYGTANTDNVPSYAFEPTISIYVDNNEIKTYENKEKECELYEEQYYCFYNVPVNLEKGEHVLSIKAQQRNINVDKFRIYRPMEVKNSYSVNIKELKRIPPREHPHQIAIDVNMKNRIPIWAWILLPSIILLLGYLSFKKFKRVK